MSELADELEGIVQSIHLAHGLMQVSIEENNPADTLQFLEKRRALATRGREIVARSLVAAHSFGRVKRIKQLSKMAWFFMMMQSAH
jgi:hypothetical protein